MRWAPYVPVAKRREQAAKKMQKLKKQGEFIQPVEIEGRTIARTFWGKSWCSHMESFCDFDNRLTRGRTYVRNGSVCHLDILEGQVRAMVSGSSLYHIQISVQQLSREKWQALKSTCMGKISSLLDLLSGKLTSGVMDVVCHPEGGLFPLAADLKFSCDCPDWATMCKHVAATLYGVGARLDADPAQLFKLRGVNFEELIDVNQAVLDVTNMRGKRKRLDDSALSELFQIETNEQLTPNPVKPELKKSCDFPKQLTGHMIEKKRMQLQLTKSEFARKVGVSITSIGLWETKGNTVINLNINSLKKLRSIW